MPDADSVPRILDGGSEWTYAVPVRPGDIVSFATVLESLKEREGRMGPMLIADYRTDYINQRGELAATQRNTVIRMGPAT
jgi:acyl dehydratase